MQSSNNPTYLKMFDIMERANPPVWANIEEGERRVLQGDYAYLSESSSIEYRVERNCDLMQVGNWLDSKGYGIGLPKGSDVNAIGTSLGLFLYPELAEQVQKIYRKRPSDIRLTVDIPFDFVFIQV